MITKLRDFHAPERVAELYGKRYNHARWPDHIERVGHTASVLDEFAARTGSNTLADLSCGDAAITRKSRHRWWDIALGDLAPGWPITGPIETTVDQIDPVDMFLCSETLEHVENPGALLRKIRRVTSHLLLTTPIGETKTGNPEHYWGWDVEGIHDLLSEAGFADTQVETFTPQSSDHYTFQIWQAS